MPIYTLTLEGHRDVRNPSANTVREAVMKLAEPDGPTYMILKDSCGSYAQAGGTAGRYRAECRDVFGEGFLHWMAASPICKDRTKTVVYYRNRCLENTHPHRRCPLQATEANVLALSDVLAILLEFLATGTRSAKYSWDDMTQEWVDRDRQERGDEEIGEIGPRA